MKLFLIRHGETTYNVDDRMQGLRPVELTAKGLKDAGLLGELLKNERIRARVLYSSPIKRAWDSAEALNLGLEIVANSAFSPRSLGVFEGKTKSEIDQNFSGGFKRLIEWDFCPEGATESLRTLFSRAHSELEKLRETERLAGEIIVVTHSGILEALNRGWLNLDPGDSLPFPLKNTGAMVFKLHEKNWIYQKTISVGDSQNVDYS